MTAAETIKAFKDFLNEYKTNRAKEALLISTDLRELVRQRVQDKGESPSGNPFAPYVPSYARQRKKEGYQINRVDYTKTGRLWANIKAVLAQNNPEFIIVEIGPTTPENILKVLGPGTGSPRKDGVQRGNPVTPSKEELDEAFEAWADGIFADFQKRFR